MKILHVTKKYPNALGGDAVVVSNLEKQQSYNGDDVVILTSNCNDIINAPQLYKFGLHDTAAGLDNITIKRLISLIVLFINSFKIFQTERPDIIHTHSVDMAFLISFAARRYNIPIVHTFHIVTFNNPAMKGIRSKIELFLLRHTHPNQIYVLNPGDIKDFNVAGFDNVSFIPNGVNIHDWVTDQAQPKNNIFTFISVGRLEEQKGFLYLIEAANKLKKTNIVFQIQIIGAGSLKSTLQASIERHKLGKYIQLMGRKDPAELKILYTKADVFVLSSLWEGMPLSLLEAWAAGLPTIATEVSSVPYIAKTVTVLVPPADSAALATAMHELYINQSYRAKLADSSNKLVRLSYDWSAISKLLYKGIVR